MFTVRVRNYQVSTELMIWTVNPQLIPEENTKVSFNFPSVCSHGEILDVTMLIVIIVIINFDGFYWVLTRFSTEPVIYC